MPFDEYFLIIFLLPPPCHSFLARLDVGISFPPNHSQQQQCGATSRREIRFGFFFLSFSARLNDVYSSIQLHTTAWSSISWDSFTQQTYLAANRKEHRRHRRLCHHHPDHVYIHTSISTVHPVEVKNKILRYTSIGYGTFTQNIL